MIGALLGADPMPSNAAELSTWIVDHPDLARSDALDHAVGFLRAPPLSVPVKLGYRLLFGAAVSTIDRQTLDVIGLIPGPSSEAKLGSAAMKSLRWALGSSPSWHLALVRAGAPVPPGLFRQSLPADESPDLG